MVFCSRSRRGCSVPKRTSALAARWKTKSCPATAARERRRVEQVAFDQPEAGVRGGALQEPAAAGREVVVDGDLVAGREQQVDEIAADEAGTAGDERPHAFLAIASRFSRKGSRRTTSPRTRRASRKTGPRVWNSVPQVVLCVMAVKLR